MPSSLYRSPKSEVGDSQTPVSADDFKNMVITYGNSDGPNIEGCDYRCPLHLNLQGNCSTLTAYFRYSLVQGRTPILNPFLGALLQAHLRQLLHSIRHSRYRKDMLPKLQTELHRSRCHAGKLHGRRIWTPFCLSDD